MAAAAAAAPQRATAWLMREYNKDYDTPKLLIVSATSSSTFFLVEPGMMRLVK
jgi:hypothetical protein